MKMSIIIPVYNSEKFLSRCLHSIFEQNLDVSEFEIIVINDGSSDPSGKIIMQFAALHKNLVYVSQSNQGVSSARNTGLNLAKGAYITFIDSDDVIENDSLQLIWDKLEKDKLDILYPNIDTYSETGERLGNIEFEGTYDDIKSGFLQERRTYPPTFYRKELLTKICFDSTISFGEDTVFNAKAQAWAQKVSFADIPYYKYTLRQNSLSKQGYSDKAFQGFTKAIGDLRSFQNQNFQNNKAAKEYFDKVYKIFVTRIIELNVMPEWNYTRYSKLVNLLEENNLLYILDLFNYKYPYVAKSFAKFKAYQDYLALKSKTYRLIYRVYKSLRISRNA